MKKWILLFLGLSGVASAFEGLFYPSPNRLNSKLLDSRYSIASLGYGSGVVVGGNKILTATHVVSGCQCPAQGSTAVCEKKFSVPKDFNKNGQVGAWKEGKTKRILFCGLRSNVGSPILKAEVMAIYPSYQQVRNDYWPQEEIAILEFDNENLRIPSVPIKQSAVRPTENLVLMGYPGASVRSRNEKLRRLNWLHQSLAVLENLKVILNKGSYSSISDAIDYFEKSRIDLLAPIDNLPTNSIDRKVLLYGSNFLLAPLELAYIWNGRLLDRACKHWKVDTLPCYLMVLNGELDNYIRELKTTIMTIQNEKAMFYDEADQSLRVSFGRMKKYRYTRHSFVGLLDTTVDGVSGNSGGPLFDQVGNLVGIASTGPRAASLTYTEGKGVTFVNHFSIRDAFRFVR